MREFLDLDKRDREILSLLEKSPEMSQNDMAEILKISQPSVSARIHKLKQKGALAHIVGMNLKKVRLHMAKVDVTANNTSLLLEVFKDCPYFLNGLIVSGKHNLCLFFVSEDIATLEAIVDGHLRNNPLVKEAEKEIEPREGFEPSTSSLPRTRYTPKPPRQRARRDSNPRHLG